MLKLRQCVGRKFGGKISEMRVLVDTNVVLDYLLEREPFRKEAEALFQAIASRQSVSQR